MRVRNLCQMALLFLTGLRVSIPYLIIHAKRYQRFLELSPCQLSWPYEQSDPNLARCHNKYEGMRFRLTWEMNLLISDSICVFARL